ncbi:MAG: hypothetical protein OEX19_14945, partial [Gammaproteobacteria bacterium]|nr:hypothetical protein [Gammaproteobacteria bacterium]
MQGCKHLLLLCYCLFVMSCDNSNNDKPDTDVKTANATPIANIGLDRTILVGKKVLLNGYDSSDLEKTPLSYHWEVIKTPPGSDYSIEDNTSAEITFSATIPGTYILGLHVNDGELRSARDDVIISVTNTKPTAIPIISGEQTLGEILFLNGSSSTDADGQVLSYHWKLISQPENSTATITDTAS